jgi:hypothetical protein
MTQVAVRPVTDSIQKDEDDFHLKSKKVSYFVRSICDFDGAYRKTYHLAIRGT